MAATRIHTQDIADANVTNVKLDTTGVTAGSYRASALSINAQGRITAAADILTTKGDIMVYDTMANPLSVGTDGQFLMADSAAGSGLIWHSLSNSDITTALGYTPVNKAGDTMLGTLVLFADPTNPLEAATKQYVDSVATGLDVKLSVRAATTGNITLSGTQTVDGVSLIVGDRVLVKDQGGTPDDPTNGIYIVSAGAWTRSTDADSSAEVTPGLFTFVEEGTVNSDTGWVLSTDGTIVLDTTSLGFAQFSNAGSFSSGAGLYQSGNSVNVGTASSSRIVVNANDIDLAMTGVSAGTYTKLTVDVYGRVTVGASATTTDIAEGTNLYFTDERVDDRVAALIQNGTGLNWTYNDVLNTLTGNVTLAPFSTSDLVEGSNLYYTDARVTAVINGAFVDNEVPSGTIDSVNDTFTLAFTPVVGSEHLFKDGMRQKPGALNDYTISGDTITFNAGNIPQTGDELLVDYRK